MSSQHRNDIETVHLITKHGSSVLRHDLLAFLKNARSFARLQVIACNRDTTPAEDKRDAKLVDCLMNQARAWGLKCKLGGDPRGFTVKLFFPGGEYNSWGGKEEGWGVA